MKKIIRFFRKIMSRINIVLSNKIMYRHLLKKKLNLEDPQTFNEKINWLKIYKYPYDDFVINCADKYKVREYLHKKGLDKYIVDLICVWDRPNQIDWKSLPQKFVIKCNHGMGYNIICKNKKMLDEKKTKKILNKWINEDFGKVSGELHYSKIERKIICEKYLGDNLIDIQFWCSYGKVLFISYINNPHGNNSKATFDENWNRLDFVTSLPIIEGSIEKPKKLNELLKIAKSISKELIFIRLDFYIINDEEIKISELSFTPASGFVKWNPSVYDAKIGKMIDLNKKI